MKRVFQKLVRDRIPEIITAKGETPHTRILEDDEYRATLREKLLEEGKEAQGAVEKEQLTEELADVLEVMHALAESEGISLEDIEMRRVEKKEKRGGFAQKLFLESTE